VTRVAAVLACAALIACSGGAKIKPLARESTIGSDAEAAAAYTGLLRDHVADGHVDYGELCEDVRLESYLAYVAATDPDTFVTRADQLAFWINAYNAWTLKVICDNYPVESINDLHAGGRVIGHITKKTVWDKKFAVVGDYVYSLNHIEHDIVRPVFDDPRAHFALVCASVSCPPLRTEAYEGSRLDAQLDDQGRLFFADNSKNRFDVSQRKAYLSKILDWYQKDFGRSDEEVLVYISRFLPDEIAADILEDPSAWSVKHLDYDWVLNE